MSCRRAHETDLVEYLAEPRAERFRAFREHYPLCPECAAEVRAWSELERTLAPPAVHPEPALLLRYEDEPAALAAAERRDLETHLAGCAPCRDELAALRGFDFAAAGAPAPVREVEPRGGGFARALERLRWLVWQPAFAYALVLALLVPLLLERFGTPPEQQGGPLVVTRERPSAESPPSAPVPETAFDALEREALALDVIEGAVPTPAGDERASAPAAEPTPPGESPPRPSAEARAQSAQRQEKVRAVSPARKREAPAEDALFARAQEPDALPDAPASETARADEAGAAGGAPGLAGRAGRLVEGDVDLQGGGFARYSVGKSEATAPEVPAPEIPVQRDGDAFVLVLPLAKLQPLARGDAQRAGERVDLVVRIHKGDEEGELVERLSVPALSLEAVVRVPDAALPAGRYPVEVWRALAPAERARFTAVVR